MAPGRTPFTKNDEDFLCQYIAKYNPDPKGRRGNRLYEILVEDADGKWGWSRHHTWHSWRDYYIKHCERLDKKIDRYIKRLQIEPQDFSPAPSQAPPSQGPPSSARRRGTRIRIPYTTEDDQKLIKFLVKTNPTGKDRLGQKLWMSLEDTERYPWAERHPWQSWRERYKNNEMYFDDAVFKGLCEDNSVPKEPSIPKPKTVDNYQIRKRPSLSQAKVVEAPNDKRKRASEGDAGADAPPKKRPRVEPPAAEQDKQPIPGPSRPRDAAVVERELPEDGISKGEVAEGINREAADENIADDSENDDEDEDDGHEGKGEDVGGEKEDSEEEGEEEEELGPPGSDDYCGEIFDSPDEREEIAEAPDQRTRSASESSERDQEELYDMLMNTPIADVEDENVMDIDTDSGIALMEGTSGFSGLKDEQQAVAVTEDADRPKSAAAEPDLSTTPPAAVSPPARKHNVRIERNADLDGGTPQLSPTEEAEMRHHLNHDHSPEPTRKRPTRFRRREDEEFFATPRPATDVPSSRMLTESSPTTHHVMHIRDQDGLDDEVVHLRPREPPRLDEGAWNKAFSDARGRPRTDSSGKRRRRSGVSFEDEGDIVSVQSEGGEEDVDVMPIQWPPVRSKGIGKVPATTATPMGGAGETGKIRRSVPDSDGLVTTERIVSVKTVRTVQRKLPSPSKGTPSPRGALAVSNEDSSPMRTPRPDGEVSPEASQHHPFSQPRLARMSDLLSDGSTSSSSLFPRIKGTQGTGVPVQKSDILRLQKMLGAQRVASVQGQPSKAERDAKRLRTGQQLPVVDYAQLENMLKMPEKGIKSEGVTSGRLPPTTHAGGALSRATMSPPGATRDDDSIGRFDAFQEHDQELPLPHPAPLAADNGSKQSSIPSQPPDSSHRPQDARQHEHVDTGKRQANSQANSNASGHMRRYTLGGVAAHDAVSSRLSMPPQQQSVRRSLPISFSIGESNVSAYRSALGVAFHPPPSGSGLSCVYAFSNTCLNAGRHAARSRAIHTASSPSPANHSSVSLVDTLPAQELAMVTELGMQTALQVMARNHGFSEETVRQVYEETRSLEAADYVLRAMRDSANEKANEALQELFEEAGQEGGDAKEEEENGDEEKDMSGARNGDEAEVESVLAHDSWLLDANPQAESSRVVPAASGHASRRSRSRRRETLIFQPLPPEERDGSLEYSPPKRTRAADYMKHALRNDSMDMQPIGSSPASALMHTEGNGVSLGQLAKYDREQWQGLEKRYGPGAAKVMTAKALKKLLR